MGKDPQMLCICFIKPGFDELGSSAVRFGQSHKYENPFQYQIWAVRLGVQAQIFVA